MTEENLFTKLSQEPRPSMVVPFPMKVNGEEPEIQIIVLTAMEVTKAKADAERRARKALLDTNGKPIPQAVNPDPNKKGSGSVGYDELYNDFLTMNILFEACRHKDDIQKRVFPSPDSLVQFLSVDQIGVLCNHYYTVQLDRGPILLNIPEDKLEDELQKIIEAAQTNPSFFLNSYALETLKALLKYSVNKISQMEKSSSGSQEKSSNETP